MIDKRLARVLMSLYSFLPALVLLDFREDLDTNAGELIQEF